MSNLDFEISSLRKNGHSILEIADKLKISAQDVVDSLRTSCEDIN